MERIIEGRIAISVWKRMPDSNKRKGCAASSQRIRSRIENPTHKASCSEEENPHKPVKLKSRVVSCENYHESEEEKDTYAGGADATAVRTAIRQAALKKLVQQR